MHPLRIDRLVHRWPRAERCTLEIGALSLASGESLFLYGPSGCGKSTLLSAIAGVVDVPKGVIRVAEQDLGALRGGARDRFRVDHIGIIFQVFNLVPWQSALENVLLPCTFSQRRRVRAGDNPAGTARRLLDELGLSDPALASKPANELSVGQQQRVAAARALIGKPDLILADEPTSALDEAAKAAFVDLLARECAEAGAALLFVSHDRSLERHFDRSVDFLELNRSAA
ncbi:putative ABC transport system ATP-binding protein [Tropicimonas sediminicola]|uniref:Putative ABC transport system ATP-binding protein n=1 Tax=Tropicimonas sediminicola TaxID=1031541 RepID=A0A239FK29_9RHOB|nr:putative ABC transport system ATP-binding protein [Tropicimonas sediminicola]